MKRNNMSVWLSVFAGVLFTLALIVALNPVSGGGVVHLNDSILASDLNSTNSASDNFVATYDEVSGGFTWEVAPVGLDALMTTRGDIVYRNATVPARLAKGSEGEVLTMGVDEPEWDVAGAGVSDPHGAAQHTDVTKELFLGIGDAFVISGLESTLGRYAVANGSANVNQPDVNFTAKVPSDFVSFISVKAVWISSAASGNMYWQLRAYFAASGEAQNTHIDKPGVGTTATAGNGIINVQEPANALALTNLAAGDFLGFEFLRSGGNPSDTLDNSVNFLGLLFTYVAHQ